MARQRNNKPRCMTAICAVACSLLAGAGQLWAAPAPAVTGSFSVSVRGSYTGQGNIAVGAVSVTIILQVTNDAGAKGQLIAANLKLTNGRFSGTGTVLGVSMSISGRVDPADSQGPVSAASIQATFSTDTNTGGRIVGTRRGATP